MLNRIRIKDDSDFQTAEFAQSTNSDAFDLDNAEGFSVVAQVTVTTPSAKTFDAGESEVTTLTFANKAGTTAGDYVVIYDTDGLGWAVAGASVKLQGSNDGSTFIDLGISNNITTSANFLMEKVDPMFKYGRIVYTMTAGQVSVANHLVIKG